MEKSDHKMPQLRPSRGYKRGNSPEAPAPPRAHDPDRTRQDILNVATAEFASAGFSGARVDMIAERTRTSKRMIYYYFGSKEGLYLAALEKVYSELRAAERNLDAALDDPRDALQQLIELTFDYQDAHPEFVRLVNTENVNNGRYIEQSKTIRALNIGIIDVLASILERGQEQGLFRSGLDPVDVHMLISAFCFFRVSNQYTFGTVFQRDLSSPKFRQHHRKMISEVILGWLTQKEPEGELATSHGRPRGSRSMTR
jgi:AcrR family transcriptional regulator